MGSIDHAIAWQEVKRNCLYFKGHIPCLPNKQSGQICNSCTAYRPVSKRILIIKLGAIGDVIRTTPLLTHYRNKYPDCHITWVTDYPGVLPKQHIDEVLLFSGRNIAPLYHVRFDIALNLDKEAEACVLLSQVHAIEKYGFTWDNGIAPATPAAEIKLLTGLFDQVSKANTLSYLQEIFAICHLDYQNEKYIVSYDEEQSAKWHNVLQEKAYGQPIVGLNTGYGRRWPTRQWPDRHWLKLTAALSEAGYYCVLLGGEDEHITNTRLAAESGALYPGTFSIQEFTAILAACDLIVSQVTMAMHLTLGLQKKLILMNNIFNPYEFDLFGLGEIVQPDEECICYFGASCNRGQSCMKDLPPEKVLDAIKRHLVPTKETLNT